MHTFTNHFFRVAGLCTAGLSFVVLGALVLTGCHSGKTSGSASGQDSTATPSQVHQPAGTSAEATNPTRTTPVTVRIRVGNPDPLTDASGNVWLGDRGFTDGLTISRESDLKIENTKDPDLYRFERYSMTGFSYPIPNGKYNVKLHFAETFEGISGPGQRVFSFQVEGHYYKDFDVWMKAGGPHHAYIETVRVEITDGKLDIKFTQQIENPEINGIEILPIL